jgi:hypothetical protein
MLGKQGGQTTGGALSAPLSKPIIAVEARQAGQLDSAAVPSDFPCAATKDLAIVTELSLRTMLEGAIALGRLCRFTGRQLLAASTS